MSSKPRLLLIDEDADDRALSRLVLSSQLPGALFDEVGEGDEFVEALDQGYYDLVVTEFETAWAQGTFLLRAIRSAQKRATIVVFTGVEDRESAVEALKAGAVDFLVKTSGGFLDLRRAAAEALPQVAVAADEATHPPPPADPPRQAPIADASVRRNRRRSSADRRSDVDRRTKAFTDDPLGFLVDPPRVAIDPLGLAAEPADVAQKPDQEATPEPDPEGRLSTAKPEEEKGVDDQPAPVEALPTPSKSQPGAPSAAEPIREAVESARQSIVAMGHRPLGAVLGIIAILAAFIILYATFFGGDSDSVEAGAPPSVSSSRQTLEPAGRPAKTELESGRPAEVSAEIQAESSARPAAGMTAPSSKRATAPSPPLAAAPLVLELLAEAEVWVQVTVDSELVLDAVLASGQVRSFEGEKLATVVIGNAAGLSVRWNGEDLGVLGREGQVRRLYFSPTEMGVGTPSR